MARLMPVCGGRGCVRTPGLGQDFRGRVPTRSAARHDGDFALEVERGHFFVIFCFKIQECRDSFRNTGRGHLLLQALWSIATPPAHM